MFANLLKIKWSLIMIVISISVIITEIESFLVRLWMTYFLSVKYSFSVLWPFFLWNSMGFVFFFNDLFKSSLYILDTNHLFITCVIDVYSQFVVGLFLFSMISFDEKSLIKYIVY